MVKRILVALDPDHDTPVATQYALTIAQRFEATVQGLAIVDTKQITADVGPGGAIGGAHYAQRVRTHLRDEAHQAARRLVADFEAALEGAGVRHGERVDEGVPAQRIIEDTRFHDLLVIGATPHFYYAHPERETKILTRVVKHSIAPALIVGADYEAVSRVLIAFDGSPPASRALHCFAHLAPFGRDLGVEVLYVPTGGESGERLVQQARLFLEAHGFKQIVTTCRDGRSPGALLVQHASETETQLIVAGTHSVSAARRFAFGSTTHQLLQESPVPLFLYH